MDNSVRPWTKKNGTSTGYALFSDAIGRRKTVSAVVAHNHPSGLSEPSQADVLLTRRLRDALALVDIRVLDHFVIGDGAAVSLAEKGLL